jgi:endonuclease YncB( thermonuclease family)
MIAVCLVDGADIGSEMVRQGWALDYERYSGGAYADEQKAAWSSGRAYGRASSSRLGNGAGHGDGSRQR